MIRRVLIASHMMAAVYITAAVGAQTPVGASNAVSPAVSPADIARQLLAADRAFAATSLLGSAAAALERTFADDIVLAVRSGAGFVRGRAAVRRALLQDPEVAGARLTWTPIRAGISADGMHGFTYGYTMLTRADGAVVPGKYVAYWERDNSRLNGGAWRISVYRRVGRPPGEVSQAERAPALPPRLSTFNADSASRARLRDELAETERAFSRDAQGGASIGRAFARYGDPSAANTGSDASFTFGPDAIGASVQAGITGQMRIAWSPDETRVASSGDLGVTIGFITVERPGADGAAQTMRIPYFTIWRRDDVRQPWRYVAE